MKSMTPRGHKTGEAWSCVDSIHNLELGEEDNLAEWHKPQQRLPAAILMMQKRTTRKRSLTQHCENTSLDPVMRLDPLS
jgi:hypothetical protein